MLACREIRGVVGCTHTEIRQREQRRHIGVVAVQRVAKAVDFVGIPTVGERVGVDARDDVIGELVGEGADVDLGMRDGLCCGRALCGREHGGQFAQLVSEEQVRRHVVAVLARVVARAKARPHHAGVRDRGAAPGV